jgi:feruloyl esterase
MIRRVLIGLGIAILPAASEVVTPATGLGTPCANLAALTIPNVTIRSANSIAAGGFTPAGIQSLQGPQGPQGPQAAQGTQGPQAPQGAQNPQAVQGAQSFSTLPAFCRVEGTARPTTDSEIRFEVWIPSAETWNGKFEGVGNGGYSGSISYPAMAQALRRGYATASTDTGHTGDDMKFGQGHPEKIVDWAWRSIHVTAETAKIIVRDHAGRLPEHSYFNGCSSGGHQALSEAQRFPDDYDGIIAGDPANNRVRQTFAFLWSWMVTHKDGTPVIPAAKLALVTKAAVEACDGLDGLKDGIIDDPRRCHFDPVKLLCKSGGTGNPGSPGGPGNPASSGNQNLAAGQGPEDTCLTQAQVDAVRKMYEGVKNPRTGDQIFTGWPRGSEGFGESPIQSWRTYVTDPAEPMRVGFFRYFLFFDPNWDWHTVDFDRDLAYAEQKLPWMAAVEKDLTPFKKRGGKLLMYTGWSDPVVPPQDAVAYYDGVVKTMGGLDKTREFFRLFLAPGMGHCSGGPGPNQFDALAALEQWVEKGVAPDKLIASHNTNGKVDRTRPLCAYPLVARWKGAGSTDEAASFACVPEPAATRRTTTTSGGQGER